MTTTDTVRAYLTAALLISAVTVVGTVAHGQSSRPSMSPPASITSCPSSGAPPTVPPSPAIVESAEVMPSPAAAASSAVASAPDVTASPAAIASPSVAASPDMSSQGPGACPAGATLEAEIRDFDFEPAELRVGSGTTVRWTNEGPSVHTVTADDGSFDSGTLEPGATFEHTFEAAGTFDYHCVPHPTMTATVVVQ